MRSRRFIGGWSQADIAGFLQTGIKPDGDSSARAWSDVIKEHFHRGAAERMAVAARTEIPPGDAVTWHGGQAGERHLSTVPAVSRANRPHEAAFPFGSRALLGLWRSRYFRPGPLAPDPAGSPEWNRGRYLVEAVAHCGECHTPRDWLGGHDESRRFAGYRIGGPDGFAAPISAATRCMASAAGARTISRISCKPASSPMAMLSARAWAMSLREPPTSPRPTAWLSRHI